MRTKKEDLAVAASVVFLGLFLIPLVAEGGPSVLGVLTGDVNTTVDGQPALPDGVIFSGDKLQVGNGAAVVALNRGNSVLLGRETEASLTRDAAGVTVVIDHGHLTVLQVENGMPMKLQAGEVAILPAPGFKTLGEVALMPTGVAVTARAGKMRVERRGMVREIGPGESVTLSSHVSAAGPQGPVGSSPAMNYTSRALVWGVLLGGALAGVAAALVLSGNNETASPSSP